MEALELITATETEARFGAPGARFHGPVGIATCVKCGAMPTAAPGTGGFGSAAGVYAAADVPPGTAGRAAALGV